MQLPIILLLFWIIQPTPDLHLTHQGNVDHDINRIALNYTDEMSLILSDEHLNLAEKIGINLLKTDQPQKLEPLAIQNFYLLLTIDNKYVTPLRLSLTWREIASGVIHKYHEGEAIFPGRIAAINLFQYPDERTSEFFEYSSLIADTLQIYSDAPLYYQTHSLSVTDIYVPYRFNAVTYRNSLPHLHSSGNVINFEPSGRLAESLIALELLFKSISETSEPVIILPADWFFQLLEKYPDLKLIFTEFINGNLLSFPLPFEEEPLPKMNVHVMLLLIVWIGLLLLYKFRPLFSDKCLRYLLSHKFYVQDIIQSRNRNIADGLYLLILHSIGSALFFYTLAKILFGPTGLNVFSFYYSDLFFEGYEEYTFLILGFVISAILHTISILWLFLFNKTMKRISQIVNLYSWGFILNILFVTVLVLSYLYSLNIYWAYTISVCYFLVWFLAFNIAAVHCVRNMESFKFPYMIFTIGLHSAIVLFIIIYLNAEQLIIETISMAHWISKWPI